MTQSSPPIKPTVSSRRETRQRTAKSSNKMNKFKKPSKSKSRTPFVSNEKKARIAEILDFKKQSNQVMYLARHEETLREIWIPENQIDNSEVVASYQQKIQAESGYSIAESSNAPLFSLVNDNDKPHEQDANQRPSRVSKIRAVMALKQPIFMEEDEVHGTKRKSKVRSTTHDHALKKRSTTKHKTKAEIQLEAQLQERLERQQQREKLNPDVIMESLGSVSSKDCCLHCAANTYRECLEKGDLEGFKACFTDVKNVPHHHSEDTPNGLDLISYAIVLEKFNFAEYAAKKNEETIKRPSVPDKYITYDSNTGHNYNGGAYGNRAFRHVQVQESRGNRLGNSAFYEKKNCKHPRGSYMNVEANMGSTDLNNYMPYITRDVFKKSAVINNFMTHKTNNSMSVYFTVASGNRLLASNLLSYAKNVKDCNTFNLVHEEVLKFNGTQKLTSYKRTQILKMASDACNLTPYHCSAIHTSSSYLKEFFDALDPAERLATDSLGRSVSFYAAVSEGTACLNFLISQQFNLSLCDKYKMTPLVQAARYGRQDNVEILIKHLRGGEEVTETHPSLFQSLLRNRRTALHYAAYFGHAATCQVLLKYGAPVDVMENLDKQTPLHFAAKNGYLDCVRVLIEGDGANKANLEKGDKYGRNALHLACIYGHLDIVKYLLSLGADADAPDSSQNSPAHYAAAYGYIHILHLLIQYGNADPTSSNVWTSTPCSVANMKGHIAIVKYLLQLPGSPIDVNFKDQDGLTMIQHTICESVTSSAEMDMNLDKMKILISMKANVNSADIEGRTCLHHLVSDITFKDLKPMGYVSLYPVKQKPYYYSSQQDPKHPIDDMSGINYLLSICNLLIKNGADLEAINTKKQTPLAAAMCNRNHFLVAALMKAGSNFCINIDNSGNNFFHYLGGLVALINAMKCHQEEDTARRNHLIGVANNIWKCVERKLQSSSAVLQNLINSPNDMGYSAIVSSVSTAIKKQKESLVREKRLIYVAANNQDSVYNRSHSEWIMSEKFKEHTGKFKIDLRLKFDYFVKFMDKIISKLKPDMDAFITLPKNYKKEHPKAKPSEFPKFTGYAALHFAAECQSEHLVKFLLRHGANPNVRVTVEGLLGNTPMLLASHLKKDMEQELPKKDLQTKELIDKKFSMIKPDFESMHHNTILLLLQSGGCPYMVNNVGESSLMKSAAGNNFDILRTMCQSKPLEGADINTKNEKDETALTIALDAVQTLYQKTHPDIDSIINPLLVAKADPNVKYKDGDTVLMRAIKMNRPELVTLFLQNTVIPIDHSCRNRELKTALAIACQLNYKQTIMNYSILTDTLLDAACVNAIDSDGMTPLSYACRSGDSDIVIRLLSLGAKPQVFELHSIPLCEAVKSGSIKSVKALLEHGAEVNQCDINGNSSLHNAVLAQKHHIVDLLLQHSADCSLTNLNQQTPLHLAVDVSKKQTNRSFRMERSLIKMGADLNAKDIFGRTPLHYVFVSGDMIPLTQNTSLIFKKLKWIIKEADIEEQSSKDLGKYIIQFGLGGDESIKEDYVVKTNTWLKEAKLIRLNEFAKSKKLELAAVKDVEVHPEEIETIKKYCKFHWETVDEIPERSDPIDIFKFLSGYDGLEYDLSDEFGRTPLLYAACVGAFSCTTLLLQTERVNINAVDTDKNGALQLALRNNYIDYSVMLCNLDASANNNVTLKDGTSISTLGFSLSKSLINVAYLIMDKGSLLIESVKDALVSGKFQMVELLLHSAKDQLLSNSHTKSGQNMWHIIADFKPFDHEIWLDYMEDFLAKIQSANPPFVADTFGRTPLHYAAMHGQDLLLKRLLKLSNARVNICDSDGRSEIQYAVESCRIDCVKTLLFAEANANNLNYSADTKSALLNAVEKKQYDIASLLLSSGALTDGGDSNKGLPNAVMAACLTQNLDMLKLLIKNNANMNTPSHIERVDSHGKTNKVLIHPIFVASAIKDSSEFFQTMLDAGADPNVYGPDSKPEYGLSCFMYNVAIGSIRNQKLLPQYGQNVDLTYAVTGQTIFYQFLFGMNENSCRKQKVKGNVQFQFDRGVYEYMLQRCCPGVNFADPVSGSTPLEMAIYRKNKNLIQRLVSFYADANIASYANPHAMNPFKKKLPAILHAILSGSLEIISLILDRCISEIDWMWQDDEGNNMLSYISGVLSGYSHSSLAIFNTVVNVMGLDVFKQLLRMENHMHLSPLLYAYHREDKTLYQVLVSLDDSSTSYISQFYDPTKFPAKDNDEHTMSVDDYFISTVSVDEDAQIERQKLQAIQDAKKAKNNSDGNLQESKIDPYSKLEKVGIITTDEQDKLYDIMLMKVELNSWGSYTDTSFYKLSIIFNKVMGVYILWTRWGPFGNEGQHQKTPFLTQQEAVAEFKAIFKSKTGNLWEDFSTSFQPKPGKYEIMKSAQHPKDTIIENFDFMASSIASDLASPVLDVMKLICNYTSLSRAYLDTKVDMPLGQVPQKRIEDARKLFQETVDLIKTYNMLKVAYTDRAKIQESKVCAFKIAQNCVAYSRLLPRYGESNKAIRSLYSHDNSAVSEEISRLEDLSYVGFAANVILAAKHHLEEMNPLDYAYRTLNCTLTPLYPNNNASTEYQLVKRYMNSTSETPFDLVHLFAVNRADEEASFRPFENDTNRKLLWHGSRLGNFMGILKQGLRIAPRTSSANGAMLGNGVYFADTFSKSLGYASHDYGNKQSAYKLLMLCEVALGTERVYKIRYPGNDTEEDKQETHCMKALGQYVPDPENTVYDSKGVCIPIGPCIPYVQPAGTTDVTPTLNHNEWAVHNKDRVKIRYLLIIRESNSCSLCSSTGIEDKSLKPIAEHALENYRYMDFNSYEAQIIKAYLTHANKTPRHIYQEDIGEYVAKGLYKKQWNIPLELQKDSKICSKCAQKVATSILANRMTDKNTSNAIIARLNQKPRCRYGKQCRNQDAIEHVTKYQHWLLKNIAKDNADDTNTTDKDIDLNDDTSEEEDEDAEDEDEDSDEENSMDTDD